MPVVTVSPAGETAHNTILFPYLVCILCVSCVYLVCILCVSCVFTDTQDTGIIPGIIRDDIMIIVGRAGATAVLS